MRDQEHFEEYRVTSGDFGTLPGSGRNGVFRVKTRRKNVAFCIVSDGAGWEHVSVHIRFPNKHGTMLNRTPSWSEMCQIKAIFWSDSECVMQLHPPEEDYVNNHPNCLHLWKPVGQEIPRPEKWLVGV